MRANLQAIVSHEEHDTVYARDLACRSFSYATLRAMVEIVLENLPAGGLRATQTCVSVAPCRFAVLVLLHNGCPLCVDTP